MERGRKLNVGLGAVGSICLAALLLWGCATATTPSSPTAANGAGAASAGPAPFQGDKDAQLLQKIRDERSQDRFSPKFELGPGDVLDVSVPDVEELKDRLVRVSPDGTISLPVAGVLQVKGMTEAQVRNALQYQLQRYVKDPEVDVFVKEYHSRQVAVMGMVQKPGFYTLMSRSDTLLDMIGRAGGAAEGASTHVIFIPAALPPGGPDTLPTDLYTQAGAKETSNVESKSRKVDGLEHAKAMTNERPEKPVTMKSQSPGAGVQLASLGGLSGILNRSDPITISLDRVGEEKSLEIPARPGDVIVVPPKGEVLVDGWVQTPGAYKLEPGMTALGAVAAAGGALFSNSAVVLRADKNGTKRKLPIDLAKVKSGEAPDVSLRPGDVVFVQRSAAGAVPYTLWELFTHFSTGFFMMPPGM